jgi:hypothetical protein
MAPPLRRRFSSCPQIDHPRVRGSKNRVSGLRGSAAERLNQRRAPVTFFYRQRPGFYRLASLLLPPIDLGLNVGGAHFPVDLGIDVQADPKRMGGTVDGSGGVRNRVSGLKLLDDMSHAEEFSPVEGGVG